MSICNQDDARELPRTACDVERASQWVRSVIAIAEPRSTGGAAIPVNGAFAHVVFEVDVDGYRYLLLRTEKPERSGYSLSPREREIVRMIALGHQNKVIAAVLCISSWTVCTHVRRIFAKLDVNSRAAMVAKVTEFGCIPESRGILQPAAHLHSEIVPSAEAALRRIQEGTPGRSGHSSDRAHAQAERAMTRKRAAPVR